MKDKVRAEKLIRELGERDPQSARMIRNEYAPLFAGNTYRLRETPADSQFDSLVEELLDPYAF